MIGHDSHQFALDKLPTIYFAPCIYTLIVLNLYTPMKFSFFTKLYLTKNPKTIQSLLSESKSYVVFNRFKIHDFSELTLNLVDYCFQTVKQ